jgi:hypothetical protein
MAFLFRLLLHAFNFFKKEPDGLIKLRHWLNRCSSSVFCDRSFLLHASLTIHSSSRRHLCGSSKVSFWFRKIYQSCNLNHDESVSVLEFLRYLSMVFIHLSSHERVPGFCTVSFYQIDMMT